MAGPWCFFDGENTMEKEKYLELIKGKECLLDCVYKNGKNNSNDWLDSYALCDNYLKKFLYYRFNFNDGIDIDSCKYVMPVYVTLCNNIFTDFQFEKEKRTGKQKQYEIKVSKDKEIFYLRGDTAINAMSAIQQLFAYISKEAIRKPSKRNYDNEDFRVQYKKYRIENDVITLQDILEIPKRIPVVKEPQIQFPQADSLERIINLCEIMNSDNKAFNKYGIAKIYSFDERQSDYYANAGVYLGLIQRYKKGSIYNYKLSNLGKQIFKLPLRSRHLRVAELILSHSPFRQTLKSYIDNANIPSKEEVIDIMRHCELYRMSENLYYRRSSTVISWINWVLNLRTE